MKKICIIILYFGKWPCWFNFFMKSCAFNPSINWLFFTSSKIPENPPKNIKFIEFTLNALNLLASTKLGFKINIKKANKIYDLRPTFGVIFEDFLGNYDFWGHSDSDIIYGNIRGFITEDMLSKYEIITSLEGRTAGHFTLYRNNPKINNLYKKVENYKFFLQAKKHKSFDESNFYKTVNRLKQKNELKCYFKTLIKEGHYANKRFILKFDNGNLFDIKNNNEYLYFHILNYKNEFKNLEFSKLENIFYISKYEIFYDSQISLFKKDLIDLKRKLRKHTVESRYIEDTVEGTIGKIGIYLKKTIRDYIIG